MKAYKRNNGKSCPGEKVCTEDKIRGEIASLHGQTQGRTLENYCHKDIPTKENGLKQGCPFFDTKPENVPPSLIGAIQAAENLRSYKTRGCLPTIDKMSAWEFCCFDTAEEVSDSIQAEAINGDTNGSSESVVGKQTPMGEFGREKVGGAFSDWDLNGKT